MQNSTQKGPSWKGPDILIVSDGATHCTNMQPVFSFFFFSSLFTVLQNTTMQKCSDISKVATFLLLCFWLSHSECLWGNYIQHLRYFTRSLICLFVSFLSFNRCRSYRKTSDTENTALVSIYSCSTLLLLPSFLYHTLSWRCSSM